MAAARLLVKENYNRSIMESRYIKLRSRFVELMVKAYLETGQVHTDRGMRSVKSLISREFTNFDELSLRSSPCCWRSSLTSVIPLHPRFTQQITRNNIKGEFNAALREVLQKNGVQALFANARSVLNALELIDAERAIFSTAGSPVTQEIIQIARDHQGANVE